MHWFNEIIQIPPSQYRVLDGLQYTHGGLATEVCLLLLNGGHSSIWTKECLHRSAFSIEGNGDVFVVSVAPCIHIKSLAQNRWAKQGWSSKTFQRKSKDHFFRDGLNFHFWLLQLLNSCFNFTSPLWQSDLGILHHFWFSYSEVLL